MPHLRQDDFVLHSGDKARVGLQRCARLIASADVIEQRGQQLSKLFFALQWGSAHLRIVNKDPQSF